LRANYYTKQYKTNKKTKLGYKVIIKFVAEYCIFNNKFKLDYYRENEIDQLGEIFSLLDGNGGNKTGQTLTYKFNGLVDENGFYEDDNFKMKAYKNRNLHIEFKDHKKVDRINQICSKKVLYSKFDK